MATLLLAAAQRCLRSLAVQWTPPLPPPPPLLTHVASCSRVLAATHRYCSIIRFLWQEYFACAPSHERDAADSLMEREFGRLARMNVGAIDDAIKQVGGAGRRGGGGKGKVSLPGSRSLRTMFSTLISPRPPPTHTHRLPTLTTTCRAAVPPGHV